MRVEQHRKRPWRIVAALGPWLLLRFLLGRVALADITRLAQRRSLCGPSRSACPTRRRI